jgi:hypothetical protein
MTGRTKKALVASKYWVTLYVATGAVAVIIGIVDGSVSIVILGIVGGLAGVAMDIVLHRGNRSSVRTGGAVTHPPRPGVKVVGEHNEQP